MSGKKAAIAAEEPRPPEGTSPESYQVRMIPIADIRRSPVNPRTIREDDQSIIDLAANIEKLGLQQPVLLRPATGTEAQYELVFGERRWRACRIVRERHPDRDCIPAFVRELRDAAAYELTVVENMQREDLSPLEEANGVGALVDLGIYTLEEIADRLGKPASWVARRAKLRDLTPEWKKAVADPKREVSFWSAKHLELVARFSSDVQHDILARYERNWQTFKISAKTLQKELSEYIMKLAAAPWKITEPGPGDFIACVKCDCRTSCQPHLFEEEIREVKGDRCLSKVCWGKKLEIFLKAKEAELRKDHPGLLLWDNSRGDSRLPAGSEILKRKEPHPYEYVEVKKQIAGAIPALVIDGAGAGQVIWLVRDKQYENASGALRPVGEDGKPLPKTMKERREALEKRRNKALLGMAKAMLEEEIKDPMMALRLNTLRLMRFIGQSELRVSYDFSDGGKVERDKLQEYIEAGNSEENNQDEMRLIAVRLFRRALFNLKNDINGNLQGSCNPENAELTFFLLGIDVQEERGKIERKIREPKVWADLNEDGTPKRKK